MGLARCLVHQSHGANDFVLIDPGLGSSRELPAGDFFRHATQPHIFAGQLAVIYGGVLCCRFEILVGRSLVTGSQQGAAHPIAAARLVSAGFRRLKQAVEVLDGLIRVLDVAQCNPAREELGIRQIIA